MEKHVGQANNQICGYFQIPKVLFESTAYKDLSALAKTTYGMLRDRCKISELNGWVDTNGNVYIYYTIKELAQKLGCSEDTVSKVMRELEEFRLITRTRQGQGKPWRVVVNCVLQGTENTPCGGRKKNHLDPKNSGPIKNKYNNINQYKKREMDADEIQAARWMYSADDYLTEYGKK